MNSRFIDWISVSLVPIGIVTAEAAESNLLERFGIFVAFVAGCATLYKILIKPGYKMFKKMQKLFDTVERIDKEFAPNGGGSMKDTLNRIEGRQVKSEQRQRVLLLDSDDLVYESDSNGMCVWINRTYSRTLNRGVDELLGNGWISCLHTEDRDAVVEEWQECVKQRRDFDMNYRLVNNGKILNVHSRAYPLLDGDKVVGYLGQTSILG